MRRRRRGGSTVRTPRRVRSSGRAHDLGQLIEAADAPALVELVRRLVVLSPEVERACFEYLREHTAKTSDARANAAAGAARALWSEIEPDLAELDEYGGGDYGTQDHVGGLLYDLEQELQKCPIPRDDRRALLDEVLPYIQSGNAGMDDALYDVAYAAWRDDEDLRDLAASRRLGKTGLSITHAASTADWAIARSIFACAFAGCSTAPTITISRHFTGSRASGNKPCRSRVRG